MKDSDRVGWVWVDVALRGVGGLFRRRAVGSGVILPRRGSTRRGAEEHVKKQKIETEKQQNRVTKRDAEKGEEDQKGHLRYYCTPVPLSDEPKRIFSGCWPRQERGLQRAMGKARELKKSRKLLESRGR